MSTLACAVQASSTAPFAKLSATVQHGMGRLHLSQRCAAARAAGRQIASPYPLPSPLYTNFYIFYLYYVQSIGRIALKHAVCSCSCACACAYMRLDMCVCTRARARVCVCVCVLQLAVALSVNPIVCVIHPSPVSIQIKELACTGPHRKLWRSQVKVLVTLLWERGRCIIVCSSLAHQLRGRR